MRVIVAGGTNAGRRDPFNGQPPDWPCECLELLASGYDEPAPIWKLNPGYLVRCPDCGAHRPA